ncbi:MAG: FAD-dependent oxidoreductase [Bacteroidales bacterium]|nr:FAD-dependent oxidoreductase [Bacteroidales bacterium]
MKKILFVILILISGLIQGQNRFVLIEAESFQNKGGWVVDQQFMDVMGSPFLMAHGLGSPVEDATTTVSFPEIGKYFLFVRTRNWVAKWSEKEAPGKFQILLDDKPVDKIFGTGPQSWGWVKGGELEVTCKSHKIVLKDLTGFNGRCDALLFTNDPDFVPVNDIEILSEFRREKLELLKEPESAGKFDFVVVGGGMAGTCAAISAARNGVKVALIQNRPVLGGNNSSEVRVHLGARINLEPYPALGNLVNEIGPSRRGNAEPAENYEDNKKLKTVLNEKNIFLFLNYHANKVEVENGEIKSILAQNIETGEILVFYAPLFADCTGDGTIGALAGAEYMSGRESHNIFGEATAPEKADNLTMGASVQWFSEKEESISKFPDIQWGIPWDNTKVEAITRGNWNWETGMSLDMLKDFEQIRDYGMLVVFSNWSYVKNHSKAKDKFKNEQLKWVAYIAGKRESRRLIGDYVLTEQDLLEHIVYPDGTASTSWTIDLHYPDPKNSELFPGEEFKSISANTKIYPYPIPFRCLYSKNINNLMMAGRNISVSHIALGTTRIMRTTGMMGEVLGMAASICKNENTTPRGVYENYFAKLKKLMEVGVGNPDLPKIQNYNLGGTLMDKN